MALFRFPKIELAPLNVPFHRRIQTLVLFIFSILHWICLGIFFLFVFHPYLRPLLLVYLLQIYFDDACDWGGRPSQWFRGLSFWRILGEYFPAKLHKEAELSPENSYIIGYHPHGMYTTGALISFGTEGLGISKIFPGVSIHLLTLDLMHRIPFYREILSFLGCASVSKQSIVNLMGKGPGNAVVIVVGGAQEAMYAKPELADLVLLKRSGFVKLAIQTGSHLVPVFSFGENAILDQIVLPEGSFFKKCQDMVHKLLGFTVPIHYGRGIFTYNYGMLSHRRSLNIVVGKPIPVEKDANPAPEKVMEFHKKYLQALEELYDRNKAKYTQGEAPPLRFI
ncbi:diacylglycerol O-acyltransferase 1 [Entomophthora muscae]|uniref:Diacylglycerol O-acyltransferase 1 n=1 Tax=Entomophthora muscae TaxID=34485 RepID=A0ACC2T7L3_9FUNG|nr:diacylglycerol O-acyltransferase 1 [Entomophthora muscae]